MIIANIIMNVIEDKHLFSDAEQREVMERLRSVEVMLQTGAQSRGEAARVR